MNNSNENSHINSSLLSNLLSGLDDEKMMLCKDILNENSIQNFLKDKELKNTMQQFLENNLNVCKTSKKNFMHRNTLLYRIEKVKKTLGIDVRELDDAITLKIILEIAKIEDKI